MSSNTGHNTAPPTASALADPPAEPVAVRNPAGSAEQPGTAGALESTAEPPAPPVAVDPAVEAADDASDTSDAVSVLTASTASISDGVREYRQLHGRSFSQMTEYWGPNDEQQNDALDFNHCWITDFFDGKLFLAPIGDGPQNALDLGTGTGIWAIDFADEFPSAEVIGIDISPIQPSWVPANCKFQIDDFEKEWTFATDHFDYIHARNLEGCIADLPKLFQQVFAHTKPGGWFEMLEFDIEVRSQTLGEFDDDHIFKRWHQHMLVSSKRMGKPHGNAVNRTIAKGMVEAGFVDVVERRWPIPIGTWPAKPEMKRLGAYTLAFLEQSIEGFGLFLLKEVLGFTYEEVQVTLLELRAALRNPKNTPLYFMHVVYGRKPERVE